MKAEIPWLRVFVEGVVIVGKLAIVLLLVGCASATQWMGVRAAAPEDTFSCYVQVLAEMEYDRVEEFDRSSGFIRAVKQDTFDPRLPRPAISYSGDQATIAIAPASTGGGSDVSVDIHRVWISRTGDLGRLPTRRPLRSAIRQDLETLAEACVL